MAPTISIAMCSYNGGRFILAQLASLAGQTLHPLEVVVCDDGSNDGTQDLVAQFARSAPFPVRFVQNLVRQGYRRNFMQAAGLCAGDIIAFCDQDDIWRADKLEKVAAAFADPDVIMVHHDGGVLDADGKLVGSLNPEGAHHPIAKPLQANPWLYSLGFTQAFRRQLNTFSALRESVIGNEEREWTAHDQWISFLGATLGSAAYLEAKLVDYRQHGGNVYGYFEKKTEPGFLVKLQAKIAAYRDYNLFHTVCANRAVVLGRIVQDATAGAAIRSNAAAAQRFYLRLQNLYRRRGTVYSAPAMIVRFRAWLGMIGMGAYSRRTLPAFSRVSVARDLVQGVMMAKLKGQVAIDTDDNSLVLPAP